MDSENSIPILPPAQLTEETAAFWLVSLTYFGLDPDDRRVLTLACEALDRAEQARVALAEHGMIFEDRFGQPRARPEIAIERDSRLAFARLIKQLDLRSRPIDPAADDLLADFGIAQ